MPLLAIDIGASRLKAARIGPEGTIEARAEAATLAHEGASLVLARLRDLVLPLVPSPAAVGVATAGQVDPQSGCVVDATPNLPGFRGLDLRQAIATWFDPPPPLAIDNDVNAAAWAEVAAAPDADPLLVVALGTGVGGAFAIGGQVISGAHHFAGEVGHLIAYPAGRPCNCGQVGCWEQYVSGSGLVTTARERHPHVSSAGDVFAAAQAGAPWASAVIDRFAYDLALGLASLTNILDPAAVILTGGLAETARHWQWALDRHLRRLARKACPVQISRFGGDGPLWGAAEMARTLRAVQ
jgi:glucokinase